jgi:hypothetical protein
MGKVAFGYATAAVVYQRAANAVVGPEELLSLPWLSVLLLERWMMLCVCELGCKVT